MGPWGYSQFLPQCKTLKTLKVLLSIDNSMTHIILYVLSRPKVNYLALKLA